MIKGSALQLDYLTSLLIWYLKCLLFGEKNNRQLSVGRRLCKTVRFFTESWRVFTWKDHQRTDRLSSSSVTSKGLNRLRSSAGYFIWRQLQWILSRGGRKSAYPSYKFCGNYFIFIMEITKTKQEIRHCSIRETSTFFLADALSPGDTLVSWRSWTVSACFHLRKQD